MKKNVFIMSLFVLPLGASCFLIKDYFSSYTTKQEIKDHTRFNNKNYGMNWGAKTDEIVNKLYKYC